MTRKNGINPGHDKHWLRVKDGLFRIIQEKWLHTENPRLARKSSPKNASTIKKYYKNMTQTPQQKLEIILT
ncbi:hypothetical protein VNO78_28291 [Psophocarpus tetragonolobus]|uniref:Uncharacterized protein n=1 Tax=Psophocarpus tetragonolobus TaxID=3891 RepID=A0AAN9XD56_PSOTE